jgi:DNA-binding SARP family transcriptional activator/streptogramin lyase
MSTSDPGGASVALQAGTFAGTGRRLIADRPHRPGGMMKSATVPDLQLQVLLLGPIEVAVGGRQVDLGGPTQRAVLACLVLRANRDVTFDELVDVLWGEDPPRTARRTLQTYVFRLRRSLAGAAPDRSLDIETTASGYRLALGRARVDAIDFERLLEAARSGDPAARRGRLDEALGLWRGRALADLRDHPAFTASATRLEEMRAAAIEDLMEARLALGEAATLVGDLEALIARDPLRERLWRALMLALYRSGRQAGALAAYHSLRSRLADELALDPSAESEALQLRMLRQDPTLDLRADTVQADLGLMPVPPPGHTGRRPWRWVAVAGAAVGILVTVAVLGTSSPPPPEPIVFASIPVRGPVTDLVLDGGALWAAFSADDIVAKLDVARRAVDATIRMPSPRAIAVIDGVVWVTNEHADTVTRVDGSGAVAIAVIEVGDRPTHVAAANGSIWISLRLDDVVVQVDARTSLPVARYGVGSRPDPIVAVEDGAWVATDFGGRVLHLAADGALVVGDVQVDARPRAIAVGAGAVWVVSWEEGTLTRIDPATLEATVSQPIASAPIAVAVVDDRVWLADWRGQALLAIDPRTMAVVTEMPMPGRPAAISAGDHEIWIGFDDAAEVLGVRTDGGIR